MEKEFIQYTEALELKELGFNEPCFGRWWFRADMHKLNEEELEIIRSNYFELPEHYTLAPLYQQAIRFFREKYDIEFAIACFYSNRLDIPYEERQYHCHVIRDGVTSKGPKYKTYEEAELACLKKLIQIVKEKL